MEGVAEVEVVSDDEIYEYEHEHDLERELRKGISQCH